MMEHTSSVHLFWPNKTEIYCHQSEALEASGFYVTTKLPRNMSGQRGRRENKRILGKNWTCLVFIVSCADHAIDQLTLQHRGCH